MANTKTEYQNIRRDQQKISSAQRNQVHDKDGFRRICVKNHKAISFIMNFDYDSSSFIIVRIIYGNYRVSPVIST